MAKDQAEVINYHKGKGWTVYASKTAPVIFAAKPWTGDRVQVKAWRGGARVPAWFYTFRSEERAEAYCREFAAKVASSEDYRKKQLAEKTAKRASLKAADFWSVGDVAYTSWGYDQTNVDWFQVVEVKPRSVVVRQISQNCSDHGQPVGGKTAPRRNEFIGPAFLCPLNVYGRFSAGPCYSKDTPSFRHQVSKWEGRAVYTSSDH
jgi:hypothetical protein